MDKNNDFKPYVSAEKVTPELTVTSVLSGIVLAVVFGSANAYLGLRVGMTVSASIPAAVIAMGVIRIILRKNSIIESNLVQTIGSAGESLAAGAIFTLPALFLWAKEGLMEKPSIFELTAIAVIGGLLGVFFMIPLRNALIVREHGALPYPEGTACAKVLLAGEKGSSGASKVFVGMGFAGFVKLVIDGLRLASGELTLKFKSFPGQIGTQIYPAVMSVGFICGPRIASYMFAGGVLGWMVLIPLITLFGADLVMYPGTESVNEIFLESGASGIWDSYIRYIGAGALAAGGIVSLFKSIPSIIKAFSGAMKSIKGSTAASQERTGQDLSMKIVVCVIAVLTVLVWLVPAIPVNLLGAIIIVVFGFFFATVSSRMVGLVGSSNNPVSGMAIATLLFATLLLKLTGIQGAEAMASAIAIGSVICIVSAIAGDTSQDLKTGYILGATPKKQQIGEIVGVIASALAIGGTLYLLDTAWGFGSEELAAPQASLMKLIIEGVLGGSLPWNLVFIGVFIALVVEIVGIPVLPFAIGIYLPVNLTACVMIGGLLRLVTEKAIKSKSKREKSVEKGILFCSGMIAGEGIIGIILALLAIFRIDEALDFASRFNLSTAFLTVGGICLLGLIILVFFIVTQKEKGKNNAKEKLP